MLIAGCGGSNSPSAADFSAAVPGNELGVQLPGDTSYMSTSLAVTDDVGSSTRALIGTAPVLKAAVIDFAVQLNREIRLFRDLMHLMIARSSPSISSSSAGETATWMYMSGANGLRLVITKSTAGLFTVALGATNAGNPTYVDFLTGTVDKVGPFGKGTFTLDVAKASMLGASAYTAGTMTLVWDFTNPNAQQLTFTLMGVVYNGNPVADVMYLHTRDAATHTGEFRFVGTGTFGGTTPVTATVDVLYNASTEDFKITATEVGATSQVTTECVSGGTTLDFLQLANGTILAGAQSACPTDF
jgi:hypothetical protein